MKKIPVNLEEKYEIIIKNISHQGEGIGRVDNFAVFVPGAMIGEEIKIKIIEIRKNFARAELEEIIKPSLGRVKPPCPLFCLCGGCQLQHMTYEKQLELKREITENAFNRIGKQKVNVLQTIKMANPWRYRNKGYFHLKKTNEHVNIGFYKERSHTLIPVSQCLLFSRKINHLSEYLEKELGRENITVFNPVTGSGNFRGIIIRESKYSGELMIIFITVEDKWAIEEDFLIQLQKTFPKIVSICQNINQNSKMAIFGKKFKILKGAKFIKDQIGPYQFKISPSSFFQINVSQTEILYEKITNCLNLLGTETIIDSYCGTGTISIYLAGKAKKVYGLELQKGAVSDAWDNAMVNSLSNLKFFSGKAEKWLYKLSQNSEKADIIIIDPPRRGCSKEVLKNIIKINPRQIIYISCDMVTLARDIKYIVQNGYRIEKMQPLDMFPHTKHIECLVHLKK